MVGLRTHDSSYSSFPKRFTQLAHCHHQHQAHKCQEARSTHDTSTRGRDMNTTVKSIQVQTCILRLWSNNEVSLRYISQFHLLFLLSERKTREKVHLRQQNKTVQHIKSRNLHWNMTLSLLIWPQSVSSSFYLIHNTKCSDCIKGRVQSKAIFTKCKNIQNGRGGLPCFIIWNVAISRCSKIQLETWHWYHLISCWE